ncbi:MAG: Fe-S oxidoreductase, partial [Gammaproteobacteria bacterium]
MIPSPQSLATVSGTALAALAALYTTLAGIALRRPVNPGRLLARQPRREPMPAVTILKPLCGAEHGLYERLRSFCEQRYPDFQIVFGVRDPGDPALTAVRQLQRDFPGLDLEVAANP